MSMRPVLQGTFGMVSSTHWLATAAGMAALERGGNAFDAAATAGLVLQVVEPHLNGPGGEVPIVGYDVAQGEPFVVDGQGVAPKAATIAAFEQLGLELVPGTGLLAATVPGAFSAWMLLLKRYGTISPRDALAPAISYARDGYPLLPRIVEAIRRVESLFTEWPTSARVYLEGGVPRPGSLFRNPDLATTYERIAAESETGADRATRIDNAERAFYEGFVAEAVDRFALTEVLDSTGDRHAGFITGADMAAWRSSIEAPVTIEDIGNDGALVCKPGPWSQGPVLLQQLRLLDGFDPAAWIPEDPRHVHTVVECSKLAFADREAFYGDPRFADVPLDDLLSESYAAQRRNLVTEEASLELRPGSPGGRDPVLPRLVSAPPAPGVGEPGDTCHVSAADRWGNLVACTPSGGWLQSSPVIPGLGFPLGTRAQMFWLQPDLPNALEPGKRPRTTLSPTLVLRDGRPILALGTPGGDQQDQWQLNFYLAHARGGMNLQEAIDAPKFHSNHFPSSFYPREAHPGEVVVEGRIGSACIDGLRRRGHAVVVAGDWSASRLSAVARDPATGLLSGAADPRGLQSYAVGR